MIIGGIKLRNIPGFSNYYVTEDGDVWSREHESFLEPHDNGNGYFNIYVKADSGWKGRKYIHQLVLLTYEGPCPKGHQIDHIDRNKSNNSLDNLRYVEPADNIGNTANKKRYSVCRKGQKKYTEEIKKQVRERYLKGERVMDISRHLDIPRQSVTDMTRAVREDI